MILDKNKLKEINQYMLGLGQPITKDDIGYNAIDYPKLEYIGRYLGDLNDEMALYILETISKYKGRQLIEYKEDIEESINYYKEKITKITVTNWKLWAKKQNKHNFQPEEVHFIKEENNKYGTSIIVKYRNFINANEFQNDYGKGAAHWIKENNEWFLGINIDYIKQFLEYIRWSGDFGFIPDKELESKIEELKNIQKIQEMKKKEVVLLSEETNGINIFFDGFIQAIHDLKIEAGRTNLRSFIIPDGEYKNKWGTYIGIDYIKKVLHILQKNHYEVADLLQFINKEKIDENKADNQLIDYTNKEKYPLPFTPYPYQIEDAKKIVNQKRVLLGHDMGCGKTLIAAMVGTSIDTPKLVIVPESLRLNWRREILNLTPDADVKVLYSKNTYETGKDWTIIGYSTASKFFNQLMESNFNCIFIDEAHNCKAVSNNGKATSKRASCVLQLCEKAEYVYPMTGTPIPTRNKDLYNIFQMIKAPEIITGSSSDFFNFGRIFCNGQHNGYGWDFSGKSNSNDLSKILNHHMVRRLKKDVLPNLTKQRVFIPIETNRKEYFDIEYRINNLSGKDTYMGLAMTGRRILSKDKVIASIDLADTLLEAEESVVIVSEFDETLDKIQEKYSDICCTIRGGISDKAKQQAIDDFQNGTKKVCALNMRAGGVGITLTKSHHMIICDYDWTPSNMSQVEDRICRSGQNEHCMIHYIYCENTLLDQIFMKMITSKSSNIDRVVDKSDNTMEFTNTNYLKTLEDTVNEAKLNYLKHILKDNFFEYIVETSEVPLLCKIYNNNMNNSIILKQQMIYDIINGHTKEEILERLNELINDIERKQEIE